jgi:hypothetical protein
MKQIILFLTFFLFGCSYGDRASWDSGSDASRAHGQQRMEERSERVKEQFPTASPGTERAQPF